MASAKLVKASKAGKPCIKPKLQDTAHCKYKLLIVFFCRFWKYDSLLTRLCLLFFSRRLDLAQIHLQAVHR